MAKVSPTKVLLVRSGRTDWEEAGRLQGQTDLPLSDSGREDALATIDAALAEESPTIGAIHCAPDDASRQTAKLIADQVGGKVKVSQDLQSLNLGLWEGLQEDQLEERFPTAYGQWREDPSLVTPPSGEPISEAEISLLTALSRFLEKPTDKTIVVVLRPFEYALTRALLLSRPLKELWSLLEDGPMAEYHTVSKLAVRDMLEARKTRA